MQQEKCGTWAQLSVLVCDSQEEDIPIMPRVDTSLELAPSGFFDSTPSTDVAPTRSTMSTEHKSCCQ